MTRCLSLDVDGTVLDTRELNRRAYEEVGVTVPEHAWGLRWEAWLPTASGYELEEAALLHRAKVEVYTRLLETTELEPLLLPPGRVARAHLARGFGPVLYFTAGSRSTTTLLLARLGILGHVEAELDYDRREKLLTSVPPGSAYVDDRLDTVVRLRHGPAGALNVIHFSGQSYERLLEELLWKPWTR